MQNAGPSEVPCAGDASYPTAARRLPADERAALLYYVERKRPTVDHMNRAPLRPVPTVPLRLGRIPVRTWPEWTRREAAPLDYFISFASGSVALACISLPRVAPWKSTDAFLPPPIGGSSPSLPYIHIHVRLLRIAISPPGGRRPEFRRWRAGSSAGNNFRC